jgi:hypothetical protein
MKLNQLFENRQRLLEKAPPDPKIEEWIKKNKKRFQDEYGKKKGTEVLYARAWTMYNDKK